jgi:hypothetical protein
MGWFREGFRRVAFKYEVQRLARSMSVYDALRVFGLGADASPQDIKRRYRELAKRWHPDKPGGDLRKMQEVNAAWDVLRKRAPGSGGAPPPRSPWGDAPPPPPRGQQRQRQRTRTNPDLERVTEFAEQAARHGDDWEKNFAASLLSWVRRGRRLTPRQRAKMEEIFEAFQRGSRGGDPDLVARIERLQAVVRSDWERGFVESILKQVRRGRKLSPRQEAKLEQLFRRNHV